MEIDEKKLKEILIEQREEFQRFAEDKFEQQRVESQRYMGILKEDFDSKAQLIGEQHGDIKKNITEIRGDMLVMKDDIGIIKSVLASHSETLASHTETLASHTNMTGTLAEDVTIIKADVRSLKTTMERNVDRKEFLGHEKRISVLEAKSGR